MDFNNLKNSIESTPGLPKADQQLEFRNLGNKDGFYFTITIPGTQAQTSSNYSYILTARNPVEVLRISEIHEAAGTDGSPVTLDVLSVPNGTAIASGNSMLASAFDLKATANTVQTRQGLTLSQYRRVRENESIGLRVSGTLTALQGVCVTLYCQNYGRGSYK